MSRSAKKCKRGTPWALLTYILLQNIKKLERGTLLRHDIKKFSKKSRTMPNKNQKGDPLVSSDFVGYVKIEKNERGDPFALISADLTRPYGSSFSSFDCKKSGPIRVRL